MTDLADKTCVPCRGDTPPLQDAELEKLHSQVPDWEILEEHHIRREFRFENFREALDFVNQVGELAEEQGHHPDISFGWGRAEIKI
ncbi:MAG: 4a-hydroxytetrahydrobiopterin dehydratase, partial [Rubrobacteraceae bacterium]